MTISALFLAWPNGNLSKDPNLHEGRNKSLSEGNINIFLCFPSCFLHLLPEYLLARRGCLPCDMGQVLSTWLDAEEAQFKDP